MFRVLELSYAYRRNFPYVVIKEPPKSMPVSFDFPIKCWLRGSL